MLIQKDSEKLAKKGKVRKVFGFMRKLVVNSLSLLQVGKIFKRKKGKKSTSSATDHSHQNINHHLHYPQPHHHHKSEHKKIKIFGGVLIAIGVIFLSVLAFFIYLFNYYSTDLPDFHELSNYQPKVSSRVYAADGSLMIEYAKERRLFAPFESIPDLVKNAFIAAEDKNFYQHSGVDLAGVFRAIIHNISNIGNGGMVGASTITQQVVKNFLLTNERTLNRKIKEVILSYRISKALSKERILELYLNEIYLGSGAYGVAAAALEYFNKPLKELTVEEAALLAAMPKAPSQLDPRKNKKRTFTRRNWVISRMMEDGYITEGEATKAQDTPIVLSSYKSERYLKAYSFADEVKKNLSGIYGEDTLMSDGLYIRTTLDTRIQEIVEKNFKIHLLKYDKKYGYRGPVTHVDKIDTNWFGQLANIKDPTDISNFKLALVLEVSAKKATMGLKDGSIGMINLPNVTWARKNLSGQRVSLLPIKKVSDVLNVGDVIMVDKISNSEYKLEQSPAVNGALIVMNPHTGAVLAMVGGYEESLSNFNRAIQAKRQVGSLIKPFVYLSAFEKNYTPADIVVDEEIELPGGGDNGVWRPQNASNDFSGPITLRSALEKSRNIPTVRVAQMVGIDGVVEILKRFGIAENPEAVYSLALGAVDTSLIKMVTAYSMIANGGKVVKPNFIEKISNRNGKVVFQSDNRSCDGCFVRDPQADSVLSVHKMMGIVPEIGTVDGQYISNPQSVYQLISVLEGVVKRGTARAALAVGKTVAGKTGTTNDAFDSWFIGFTPNLVIGAYIGFDQPTSLGKGEFGGTLALPMVVDVMKESLQNVPNVAFKIPNGIQLVRIDMTTGKPAGPASDPKHIIYEAFKKGDRIPEEGSFSDSIDPFVKIDEQIKKDAADHESVPSSKTLNFGLDQTY